MLTLGKGYGKLFLEGRNAALKMLTAVLTLEIGYGKFLLRGRKVALKRLTSSRANRQTSRTYQMTQIKILTEMLDSLSPIWHSVVVGREESPPRNIGTAGRT